jgi:hypothetical protein
MKNTIYKNLFIYLFILCSTYCFSQTNLQFNNVISAYGFENPSPIYTVPSGKVWKIERYTRDRIVVNGIGLQDTFFTNPDGYGLTIDTSPIWLKSGDTFYINSGNYFFNGIEYNNVSSENLQNRLAFNSVVSEYGTGTTSPIYTVPAGKIWKIERHTRNRLVINGISIQDVFEPSLSYDITINTNPIWLKEGDTFYINASNYSFSALEFNKLN